MSSSQVEKLAVRLAVERRRSVVLQEKDASIASGAFMKELLTPLLNSGIITEEKYDDLVKLPLAALNSSISTQELVDLATSWKILTNSQTMRAHRKDDLLSLLYDAQTNEKLKKAATKIELSLGRRSSHKPEVDELAIIEPVPQYTFARQNKENGEDKLAVVNMIGGGRRLSVSASSARPDHLNVKPNEDFEDSLIYASRMLMIDNEAFDGRSRSRGNSIIPKSPHISSNGAPTIITDSSSESNITPRGNESTNGKKSPLPVRVSQNIGLGSNSNLARGGLSLSPKGLSSPRRNDDTENISPTVPYSPSVQNLDSNAGGRNLISNPSSYHLKSSPLRRESSVVSNSSGGFKPQVLPSLVSTTELSDSSLENSSYVSVDHLQIRAPHQKSFNDLWDFIHQYDQVDDSASSSVSTSLPSPFLVSPNNRPVSRNGTPFFSNMTSPFSPADAATVRINDEVEHRQRLNMYSGASLPQMVVYDTKLPERKNFVEDSVKKVRPRTPLHWPSNRVLQHNKEKLRPQTHGGLSSSLSHSQRSSGAISSPDRPSGSSNRPFTTQGRSSSISSNRGRSRSASPSARSSTDGLLSESVTSRARSSSGADTHAIRNRNNNTMRREHKTSVLSPSLEESRKERERQRDELREARAAAAVAQESSSKGLTAQNSPARSRIRSAQPKGTPSRPAAKAAPPDGLTSKINEVAGSGVVGGPGSIQWLVVPALVTDKGYQPLVGGINSSMSQGLPMPMSMQMPMQLPTQAQGQSPFYSYSSMGSVIPNHSSMINNGVRASSPTSASHPPRSVSPSSSSPRNLGFVSSVIHSGTSVSANMSTYNPSSVPPSTPLSPSSIPSQYLFSERSPSPSIYAPADSTVTSTINATNSNSNASAASPSPLAKQSNPPRRPSQSMSSIPFQPQGTVASPMRRAPNASKSSLKASVSDPLQSTESKGELDEIKRKLAQMKDKNPGIASGTSRAAHHHKLPSASRSTNESGYVINKF